MGGVIKISVTGVECVSKWNRFRDITMMMELGAAGIDATNFSTIKSLYKHIAHPLLPAIDAKTLKVTQGN